MPALELVHERVVEELERVLALAHVDLDDLPGGVVLDHDGCTPGSRARSNVGPGTPERKRSTLPAMRGAIAAGHPLTAEAGARVLREGGNAVDALLAAAFAAFVTEGPLTGPTGGGFALVHEPSGQTTMLDCFFQAPTARLGEMEELLIDFGDSGTQMFHIGEGSVAVPGLVAGLEQVHGRFASRDWRDLVEPAIALAGGGFRA